MLVLSSSEFDPQRTRPERQPHRSVLCFQSEHRSASSTPIQNNPNTNLYAKDVQAAARYRRDALI
jgi:hypothetical protein